ncbi:PAS domain S-box protein [Candidatus Nitrotoga arctica]|uniref:histidine kinase n=1 Tax=Candidatus Nitrotoga arctica TaxID=453162 RepID=A0ABM8Z154_9PROT|nr:PAS domain S-box protein [Candidatus Nitrotoga arctica]CAG9933606.1 Histidine kinase [Candidatus Nitrotoga arctica]
METEPDRLDAVVPSSQQRELENYKFVFDQHAIISVTDAAGSILDANELFSKISGFSREELIGRDHRMLNSGYHLKDFFEGMWLTIGAGKVWQSNIRNRRKNGEFYWVSTTIVPLLGENGQPHKYVAICTDITAQVKTEEELQCSQQVSRGLSETVAVIPHRGSKLIHANPVTEFTNFTHDELLSMDYWELAHSDSRELAHQRGEAMDAHSEYSITPKSDTEIGVERSAANTEHSGELAVLVTGITDSKRAEVAQLHAQQVLAQIVNANPMPKFVIDANCVVTHWNKACEMITGISAAEMVGTNNHWRAFYTERRLVLSDLVVKGVSEAEIVESHYSNPRCFPLSDGAYNVDIFHPSLGEHGLWLSCTAAPLINEQKQIVGALTTFRDITKQKFFEEELNHAHRDLEQLVQSRTAELEQANLRLAADVRNRERAEAVLLRRNMQLSELNARLNVVQEHLLQNEKMASIGQLAAGVAHEINNPIGYVHSNIGALETYLNDLFLILDAYASTENVLMIDAAAHAELQRLKAELNLDFLRMDIPLLMAESKEGISRVSKIVQDLKDFSHVNSSQEWKWVNLHQGLNSTLNVVNNEIKYKAKVVKEYGILPEIECLPSEINQVFLNLLVNAAHAIADAERGIITLRSGCDDLHVWIEVADTGSGIVPENLKRIFDPFFTTKPIGKGTGLGLSLSYGIVTKHGGSIEVESKVGTGTTFRVILPQRQSHESTQEETP